MRALPFFVMDVHFGEIQPHIGRFPKSVEDALFFLLLAPWENWSLLEEVDWRGFRIPWVYTLDDDLFVAPSRPPSPDSLSFEPWIVQNSCGEELELERPIALPLDNDAINGLYVANEGAWAKWQVARASRLFETPTVHFLVRAFLTDGIDEFIAHLVVVDAALGLESDHRKYSLPKNDPSRKLSATKCIARRLHGALGCSKAAQDYEELFNLRSAYIHGRAAMESISTRQRVLARSLTRRVACAMVTLASAHPESTRAECLSDLFANG